MINLFYRHQKFATFVIHLSRKCFICFIYMSSIDITLRHLPSRSYNRTLCLCYNLFIILSLDWSRSIFPVIYAGFCFSLNLLRKHYDECTSCYLCSGNPLYSLYILFHYYPPIQWNGFDEQQTFLPHSVPRRQSIVSSSIFANDL